MNRYRIGFASVIAACICSTSWAATPTQMTVQGRLTDLAGIPLPAGSKSLAFRIFDDSTAGNQIWPVSSWEFQSITSANDGLWIAMVGALIPLTDSVFSSTDRWLEVSVNMTIMPRIRLVTGPYAYRVATVDGASGGTITSKVSIGPGHTNTGSFAFVTGADNQATGNYSAVSGGALNSASGESSVIAGGQQNTATAFATTVGGGADNDATNTHSVVAGGLGNTASGERSAIGGGLYNSASASAANVAGGKFNTSDAEYATIGGGESNQATGSHSVVSGGLQGSATGSIAAVGGGSLNQAQGDASTVAGGELNRATWFYSSIGGGTANTASNTYSAISGGFNNISSGIGSTVGGGGYNRARGQFSTVAGGGGQNIYDSNAALGTWSTVGGGSENIAGEWASTVAGGFVNLAMDSAATIGGGVANGATGLASTIGGGSSNSAAGTYSTVAGGISNYAGDSCATIGGGGNNRVHGLFSTIAGGGGYLAEDSNAVHGWWGTIGGGRRNLITSGISGTVAGGTLNAAGHFSFVGGGGSNQAWGGSSVVGGSSNEAGGTASTVGGGNYNKAVGEAATVPGGYACEATGDYSLAAGFYARTHHSGSFVWADQTLWLPGFDSAASTAPNQFIIRAAGGVGIGTTEPNQALHVMGNILASGCVQATNINCASDARLKANIQTLPDALEKVSRLRGVLYDWRRDEFPKRDLPKGEQIGVIAQEVQQVLPQAVTSDKEGYLAVDYTRLVPLLIEGMKDQQKQIEMQQAQIDQLKQKLEQ